MDSQPNPQVTIKIGAIISPDKPLSARLRGASEGLIAPGFVGSAVRGRAPRCEGEGGFAKRVASPTSPCPPRFQGRRGVALPERLWRRRSELRIASRAKSGSVAIVYIGLVLLLAGCAANDPAHSDSNNNRTNGFYTGLTGGGVQP
jgi:hypothetical protein